MIHFLVTSTCGQVLLIGLYKFVLEQEKMHKFNRFFLLFSLVFSLVLPFIHFEIASETAVMPTPTILERLPGLGVPVAMSTVETTNYWQWIFCAVYFVPLLFFSVRFSKNLSVMARTITWNHKENKNGITYVLVEGNIVPHTFLHYIFLPENQYREEKIEAELFTHEETHARQFHSLDILFIEILRVIFWFNPILVLYKKAIRLNHEFLADEKVVKSYDDVPFYQNLLLEKASWSNSSYLASNLNFLVTKKRLIMMTKTTSAKMILLKKLAVLPVVSALIYLLSVETVAQQASQPPKAKTQESNDAGDRKRDAFFAGTRIMVHQNGHGTKTGVVGANLILDKLYEELTPAEKKKYTLWLYTPKPLIKKAPTQNELNDFKNKTKYAIWVDEKEVPNAELSKYTPGDIAYFSGSVVRKNARTQKHPQPFQYWLFTHSYFDKKEMGKEVEKYGADKIEIFENYTVSKK